MQAGKWWFVAIAGLALPFGDARADSPDGGWQLSFPFSLARPYSSSVFIDYRKSASRRFDDVVNVGGYFQYKHDNWDTTAYLFTHDTPLESHQWVYGGRIRYRFTERHKFGIENLGLVLADVRILRPDLKQAVYQARGRSEY